MVEYKVEFVWLSQYAIEMVSQENDRCQRFRFELHCDIQLYLVTHDNVNFNNLVDKAKAIEEIKAS